MDCENCPVRKYCETDPSEWPPMSPEEVEEIILKIRECFLDAIRKSGIKKTFTFRISYN